MSDNINNQNTVKDVFTEFLEKKGYRKRLKDMQS